jgi:nitrate/nitrite transporter NarK
MMDSFGARSVAVLGMVIMILPTVMALFALFRGSKSQPDQN